MYIDISTFRNIIEQFLPKIAFTIITLFIVNIFLKISLPIIKSGIQHHFKGSEWKVVKMLYVYFVWFIALIIIISGVFGNITMLFTVAKEVAGEEMKHAARLMRQKTSESVLVEFAHEEPVLRVEFADSSTIIKARVMCLPKRIPAIRSEIYRRVLEEFNKPEHKDKVEIAYPHMELVLHDEVMSERVKRYLDEK